MKYGIFRHDERDRPKLVSLNEYDTQEEAEGECDKLNTRWQTCAYYSGGVGENREYIKLSGINIE